MTDPDTADRHILSAPIPGQTFWQWTFWLIVIHTALLATADFVALSDWLRSPSSPLASFYRPGQFLPFAATCVLEFTPILMGILVVFNAFALCLIRLRIQGRHGSKSWTVYLLGSISILTLYFATFLAIQLHGGSISSGQVTISMGPGDATPAIAGTVLLAAPTILILIGRLRFPAPRVSPGHCRHCGYNLTANTTGICPECGSPITPKPAGG